MAGGFWRRRCVGTCARDDRGRRGCARYRGCVFQSRCQTCFDGCGNRTSRGCCFRSDKGRRLGFHRQLRTASTALGARTERRLSQRHSGLSRVRNLSRARRCADQAHRDAFGARTGQGHACGCFAGRDRAALSCFLRASHRGAHQAGIARDRLILDPGMGFFLGSNPDASLTMLRSIPQLKRAFGLPVLVSVSRKSFLRKITGRDAKDRALLPWPRSCSQLLRVRITSEPTIRPVCVTR